MSGEKSFQGELVVELGSGTGVAGLTAAVLGARVMLTGMLDASQQLL